jgi:predicted unusual protein kinase regulating ubiquinone biosynthesis (AarF/ABC1/UbiB family)
MFDQLFVHGYFHADPHPGNIFVTPLSSDGASAAGVSRAWKFTFIDFGMMGEVPAALRHGLQKLLIAAASRDGKGMVDGIREVGVLLPSADTAELELAMTKLFARFGGMGFAELQDVDPREFRAFATEFGDVVRSLPFQLPEHFLLIIRAMSLTSGMCSSLDPAFNIWNAVEPYSAQLIRAEGGNLLQTVAKQALSFAGVIARLPQRLDNLTTQIEQGSISAQTPRVERRLSSLERTGRQIISAVVFAALLIGGILLRSQDVVFGTVVMAASSLPLLYALFAGLAARRGPLP